MNPICANVLHISNLGDNIGNYLCACLLVLSVVFVSEKIRYNILMIKYHRIHTAKRQVENMSMESINIRKAKEDALKWFTLINKVWRDAHVVSFQKNYF